ncbi:GDSL-type esterase/lipase family protein [Prosthecobacter sp.]|uniref:GDSL-type esterase/lipase family protein n=1 Tax=Prosthecobacter sp. TaxID=1965333 RepID=UPI003783569E
MTLIFAIHLAATWMLVGLIWVVQILVYPQFLRVDASQFKTYHFAHCFRIGLAVAPLLFMEAATAAWIVYRGCDLNFILSACLIPVIWITTAIFQAPQHTRLLKGFDACLIRRLILTNWIRTLAWTARGILVSLTLIHHPLLLSLFTVGSLPHVETSSQFAAPVMQVSPGGTITLQSSEPDSLILYTLDGTEPVALSNPYLAPIELACGGALKARVFSKDRREAGAVLQASVEPLPGRQALPSTVVPVTQDRSWPQYDWQQRLALTAAAVQRSKPEILFIGDSILHFFGGEKWDSYALAGQDTWKEHYSSRKVGNLGFGWDKTENVLWRLQHGTVDGISPKVVVLLIGTNNVSSCSASDIALGIKSIVLEIEQRLPHSHILLLGILPRGENPNPLRDKIAEVNGVIAKLDGTHQVSFLDIGAKFLNPEGCINKDLMPGFLHPNEKGYRILAEAIEPALTKLLKTD